MDNESDANATAIPVARSFNMSRIKGKDTKPELFVRRMLHSMGYRFRLHAPELPGTPDIVFRPRKKVVFVHGCFWHRHPGCEKTTTPKTRHEFWREKFERNVRRDHAAQEQLCEMGWSYAYSADEWESLRYRAMAISAVMVLIDQEDAKNTAPLSTHPKAATRIFQLLGHITEMPLIPAQRIAVINGYDAIDPNDLPSNEEQTAYGKDVSIPCFFDAVNLAQVAGADSIRQDLGEAQDFFADVGIAKAADPAGFDAFKTDGARQWADLVLFNETLKTYQTLPDGLT